MRTPIVVIVVVIVMLIFLGPGGQGALFSVDETQLVVVTRFGEIRGIHTSPGLKVKAPFIDSVNTFDKRLLRVDVPPSRLPDVNKEFLDIDAYARYKITDVRKFFEKLQNLDRAEDRIGRIVVSALRDEIGNKTKEEIIGARVEETVDEETGEKVRTVIASDSRQDILDRVLAAADNAVKSTENDWGIAILDVRMKRADFPEAAKLNIFNRMRAERERISREFRAQGQEERDTIEAAANKERTIILAEAERDAARLRGEGEGEAIEIFARALEQDPEFFAFERSLQAYRKFLSTNTTVILSSDAELFQVLEGTQLIPVRQTKTIVGPIEILSGNLWTVGGREVQVNGATRINLADAPSVGLSIFVEGAIQEDGSMVASQVIEGISGLLEEISVGTGDPVTQEWKLRGVGRVITVNEDSNIQLGASQVGLEVLIGFQIQDDGSLLAVEGRIE